MDLTVTQRIVAGLRPTWPHNSAALGLTSSIQAITERAWLANPSSRPGLHEIKALLIEDHATDLFLSWNDVQGQHLFQDEFTCS